MAFSGDVRQLATERSPLGRAHKPPALPEQVRRATLGRAFRSLLISFLLTCCPLLLALWSLSAHFCSLSARFLLDFRSLLLTFPRILGCSRAVDNLPGQLSSLSIPLLVMPTLGFKNIAGSKYGGNYSWEDVSHLSRRAATQVGFSLFFCDFQ